LLQKYFDKSFDKKIITVSCVIFAITRTGLPTAIGRNIPIFSSFGLSLTGQNLD
jgi:hypothetical protein